MHNYHLMNLLKDDMEINSISIHDQYNVDSLINKKGVQHIFIKLPFESMFNLSFRFKVLDNWVRAYKDWIISKEMFKVKNSFESSIMEFMDIHSEGYYFLKSTNYIRDSKVIIRSHTPWTLLKKYYKNNEKRNIDSKWTYDREYFCFKNCDAITTPSENLKMNLVETFNLDGVTGFTKEEVGFLHPNSGSQYTPTGEAAFDTLGLRDVEGAVSQFIEARGLSGSNTITVKLFGSRMQTGILSDVSGIVQEPLFETRSKNEHQNLVPPRLRAVLTPP